jgi:hypothetical protein
MSKNLLDEGTRRCFDVGIEAKKFAKHQTEVTKRKRLIALGWVRAFDAVQALRPWLLWCLSSITACNIW